VKFLQGLLGLILLITSRNVRNQWLQAADRASEANDAVEASLRRLDVMENAGKPRLRLLK